MNKGKFSAILPHLIAVAAFLVVAVLYCSPVLQGEVLQQHDTQQWRAMAQNSFAFKDSAGHFPLWSNGMFSGMPAYQIAMDSPYSVSPGIFYDILTLWLPKPISFFFLACLCFYFLTQVLRTKSYLGMFAALAYAYATYNPIIIGAGHDTKMQAIALMPAFIGSLILVFEGKWIWGAALTALSTSLLIGVNHLQIAYYTLIIAFFMGIGYLVHLAKQGNLKHFGKAVGIIAVAGVIGVLSNSLMLFTTYEFAKETIRGGSELADSTTNNTKTGLNKDYALSYSMYKTEPFVMMVPNMYGGSSGPIEEKISSSKTVDALSGMPQELAQQLQGARTAYWGGIGATGTSGPPYVGAIICFLALVGFFTLNNKHKWWMLGAIVLTLLMSWGEYLEGFNVFLLNTLPMYNKFRAPSMILVVPTFLLGMMAVMTLQQLSFPEKGSDLWPRYKKGLMLAGGALLAVLLVYFSADFTGLQDKMLQEQAAAAPPQVMEYVNQLLSALRDDRKSLFMSSFIGTFFFMAVAAAVLYFAVKGKLSGLAAFIIVGSLAFIDLIRVDLSYLNKSNFEEKEVYDQAFQPTAADQQIMQDKGYYRVLDLRQGIGTAFNGGARAAYFYNLIGGYNPAKLSIYQDLIENQLYKFPQSLPVVNMLNTKYVVQADQQGKEQVYPNPQALGAAWFVSAIRYEPTARKVMDALTGFNPADTAVVFETDKSKISVTPGRDSANSIALVANKNDEITYKYSASQPSFAVFSEVFYDKGWHATVDGKELPIIRTNYALRGLVLPAGQNKEVKFVFHPESYYTGALIGLICGLLVFALIALALFFSFRNKKAEA